MTGFYFLAGLSIGALIGFGVGLWAMHRPEPEPPTTLLTWDEFEGRYLPLLIAKGSDDALDLSTIISTTAADTHLIFTDPGVRAAFDDARTQDDNFRERFGRHHLRDEDGPEHWTAWPP
jgi:hypothetical protein